MRDETCPGSTGGREAPDAPPPHPPPRACRAATARPCFASHSSLACRRRRQCSRLHPLRARARARPAAPSQCQRRPLGLRTPRIPPRVRSTKTSRHSRRAYSGGRACPARHARDVGVQSGDSRPRAVVSRRLCVFTWIGASNEPFLLLSAPQERASRSASCVAISTHLFKYGTAMRTAHRAVLGPIPTWVASWVAISPNDSSTRVPGETETPCVPYRRTFV